MPSPYKATLFFTSGDSGWTETFYKVSDAAVLVAANVVAPDGIFGARQALLNRECYIRWLRVSNVDHPRDAYFTTFLGASGRGTFDEPQRPNDKNAAEQVTDAVNLRLFNGTTTWRSFLLRGLGDGCFTLTGNLRAAGPFRDLVAAFRQKLTTNAFAIQRSDLTGETGVTAIARVNDRVTAISVEVVPAGTTINRVVVIRGGYGVTGLNRKYRVVGPPPILEIRVAPGRTPNFGVLTANTARLSLITYTYPVIESLVIVGVTSRRTGRPSFQPRGSRPARRS